MNPVDDLRNHFREIALLSSSQATLEWDERTGLPTEGAPFRAEQVTLLSGLIHVRRTDPRIGEWLAELESELNGKSKGDNDLLRASLRCWKRDYLRDTKLPQSLVESLTRAITLGQNAWSIARPKNDYASFVPHLREIIRLRREEASLLTSGSAPLYDAMLDQYEEGASSLQIQMVFDDLKKPLVELVQRLLDSKDQPTGAWLNRGFPIEQQKVASRWIAEKIGFDFDRGRLDITDHPFCTTLGPSDHRILTRYHDDNLSSGFFGTLHEAGHGMYEQGLPVDWFGMPPGQAASLGVHESQSRLWENMVGRSHSFWKWCLPHLQRFFPATLANCDPQKFFRDINHVSRSLIRVEADEATYNLHVLIRFELEQALMADDLQVEELPSAWNDKYESYLGIRPSSDSAGVLQDVHWSAGLFGYFPTYTLGNIYAAQLFNAASKELGPLDGFFAQGDFVPLLRWLRSNIHQHGRNLLPRDLVTRATGQSISSKPLIDYLNNKLSSVYRI